MAHGRQWIQRSILALACLRPAPAPSSVDYSVHVDSAGTSEISFEMRVHNAPAVFQVAMATHAEATPSTLLYNETREDSRATVTVSGYDRPTARITPRSDATAAQRALLTRWLAGQ